MTTTTSKPIVVGNAKGFGHLQFHNLGPISCGSSVVLAFLVRPLVVFVLVFFLEDFACSLLGRRCHWFLVPCSGISPIVRCKLYIRDQGGRQQACEYCGLCVNHLHSSVVITLTVRLRIADKALSLSFYVFETLFLVLLIDARSDHTDIEERSLRT